MNNLQEIIADYESLSSSNKEMFLITILKDSSITDIVRMREYSLTCKVEEINHKSSVLALRSKALVLDPSNESFRECVIESLVDDYNQENPLTK